MSNRIRTTYFYCIWNFRCNEIGSKGKYPFDNSKAIIRRKWKLYARVVCVCVFAIEYVRIFGAVFVDETMMMRNGGRATFIWRARIEMICEMTNIGDIMKNLHTILKLICCCCCCFVNSNVTINVRIFFVYCQLIDSCGRVSVCACVWVSVAYSCHCCSCYLSLVYLFILLIVCMYASCCSVKCYYMILFWFVC